MTILSSIMQFAMLPLQNPQGGQPIISYNYVRKIDRNQTGIPTQTISCCLCHNHLVYNCRVCAVDILYLYSQTRSQLVSGVSQWALRIYLAYVSSLWAFRFPASKHLSHSEILKISAFLPYSEKILVLIHLLYFAGIRGTMSESSLFGGTIADAITNSHNCHVVYINFRKL